MADRDHIRMLRVVGSSDPRRPDALSGVAEAAVSGDNAALRTLLFTLGPHLLQVVRRVLGPNHPEVDDAAQEAAIAVVDALERHRGESTVLYLACRIAALTAMKVRRREATLKRSRVRDDSSSVELLPSQSIGPDESYAEQVSAKIVRELLGLLPVEQAEALALHCVLGYSVQEIADACHIPKETVRSRLRLSKQALRMNILNDPYISGMVEQLP
jgi:RNA polymerase sigma factor (sigma-70 family)